jgi:hypothetical protein
MKRPSVRWSRSLSSAICILLVGGIGVFVAWQLIRPTKPFFEKVQPPAQAQLDSYDFLAPRPFEQDKMLISVGYRISASPRPTSPPAPTRKSGTSSHPGKWPPVSPPRLHSPSPLCMDRNITSKPPPVHSTATSRLGLAPNTYPLSAFASPACFHVIESMYVSHRIATRARERI